MNKEKGCVFDLGPDGLTTTCVLEDGDINNCCYAIVLDKNRDKKEKCVFWKPESKEELV